MNAAVGTSEIILPGLLATAVDDAWLETERAVLEVGRELAGDREGVPAALGRGNAAPALARRGLRWALGLGIALTESRTRLDVKSGKCESDPMGQAAKKLLDEFEALPDQDRSEVIAEVVRRVALAPHDLPQDEDLVAAADRLFTELDRREQSE